MHKKYMAKNKMNWKIWSKKLGLSMFEIVLAGGAVVYTGNPFWLTIVPVIEAARNWLKHRK